VKNKCTLGLAYPHSYSFVAIQYGKHTKAHGQAVKQTGKR